MEKKLKAALFALGFTSVIAQILLIRELAASFYGNEFFTGWTLFSWLLWTSLGSSWGSERPRRATAVPFVLAGSFIVTAVLSVLEIALIRSGRLFFGSAPGVLPDLFPALVFSFMIIGPLCFLLGCQFTMAARMAVEDGNGTVSGKLMGLAYLFETFGFVFGGAAFSFLLVRMNAFGAASMVFGINGAVAAWLLLKEQKKSRNLLMAVFILLAGLLALNSARVETLTAGFRFPSEKLELSENTLRGNITVTRLGGQRNFYQNGMLLGAEREDLLSEHLVHFPMLAHPAPRRVLFLGMGLNGPLNEVLKHGPDEVVAVDMDPEFGRIAAGFLPEDLKQVLFDRRLRFWTGDPRDFLRRSSERFDVIIANFPDPLSMMIDRYYTREFFEQARARLAPGGVFATRLGFSANYVAPELERLGSSVYATLGDVFPVVRVLPEDAAYFIAGADQSVFFDAAVIGSRVRERKIKTDFVTPDYARYRFMNDRVEQVETVFRNSIWKLKNLDYKPQSYYFAFARWVSQFHPRFSRLLTKAVEVPFPVVAFGLALLVLGPVFFPGSREGNMKRLSLTAIRTVGFTVMSFEVILIYLFQVCLGDLYYRIAVLITLFMAGIGSGAWLATSLRVHSFKMALAVLHSTAAFFYAGVVAFMFWDVAKGSVLGGAGGLFFYGAAVFGGILAGLEFPFVSGLYLETGRGERLGAVYAADLAGSCVGALVTAAFLLPVWGVKKTLALMVMMNALTALFLFFRKDLGRKDL